MRKNRFRTGWTFSAAWIMAIAVITLATTQDTAFAGKKDKSPKGDDPTSPPPELVIDFNVGHSWNEWHYVGGVYSMWAPHGYDDGFPVLDRYWDEDGSEWHDVRLENDRGDTADIVITDVVLTEAKKKDPDQLTGAFEVIDATGDYTHLIDSWGPALGTSSTVYWETDVGLAGTHIIEWHLEGDVLTWP